MHRKKIFESCLRFGAKKLTALSSKDGKRKKLYVPTSSPEVEVFCAGLSKQNQSLSFSILSILSKKTLQKKGTKRFENLFAQLFVSFD